MANRTYLIISTNIDIAPGIVSYIITYAGNGVIQLCIFTSISDVFQFAPFATVSSVCSVLCDDQKWFENTLQWRNNNGHDSVSNHQSHHCLLNRLFRRRSKKTSKLHVTGLCAGNSPVTDEFPAQMASNAENVSIWWRHREKNKLFT